LVEDNFHDLVGLTWEIVNPELNSMWSGIYLEPLGTHRDYGKAEKVEPQMFSIIKISIPRNPHRSRA
jgi:hypothetical protein